MACQVQVFLFFYLKIDYFRLLMLLLSVSDWQNNAVLERQNSTLLRILEMRRYIRICSSYKGLRLVPL